MTAGERDAIAAKIKGGYKGIQPDLFKSYADNLRGAVALGKTEKYGSPKFDIRQQMQANVTKFAACKAWHATQQAAESENPETVIGTFNHYQVAEYNTAVARARTADQWVDFNADPEKNQLYPSLKWLPSRSADPREEHIAFYGLVLPKTHPFWQSNQPGNLWNCKCDWEECDAPAFTGTVPTATPARGLEGNPGETGEIFTDKATYFQFTDKKERKAAKKAESKILGKQVLSNAKSIQGKVAPVEIKGVGEVNVEFNRKTSEHLEYDIKQKKYGWLLNEYLKHLPTIISKQKVEYVAEKDRHNPDKKRNVEKYYYSAFELPDKTVVYFNFEKRTGGKWLLHSVTDRLNKCAIKIE